MSNSVLINRWDLMFQLFEVLDDDALTRRQGHADRTRATLCAAFETAHTIAEEKATMHEGKAVRLQAHEVVGLDHTALKMHTNWF